MRQLSQNLTVENLARASEDGRMQPWLAESWNVASDGRTLTVKLRPGVTFHDGSALDAAAAAAILPGALRNILGPLYGDVDHISAVGNGAVEITFRKSSSFVLDALEAQVQKQVQKPGPSTVGTGPFSLAPDSANAFIANSEYYLGRPVLDRIEVESFPTVRAAWAELLRDHIDVLYEVGNDALPSMQTSSSVSVFSFTRRYQHLIALNAKAPALQSRDVRRAINLALDRDLLVKEALNGQGIPSSGPIWPHHWAFRDDLPRFTFDPARAAAMIDTGPRSRAEQRSGRVRFTCLVPPDAVTERIALETKRQLASVGIDMAVEEVSQDQLFQRLSARQYDAVLTEGVSGPTLFRPYLFWHSDMPFNYGGWGNATIDAALDRVRDASSDDDTRTAVAGLQQAFMDDPPAVFLAWSVRARAVSKRFTVPPPEPGREILSTLRLWRPAAGSAMVSRN